MKYLLDTDTCIYIINERIKRVLDHFREHSVGDLGISSITASELAFGVVKIGSAKNRALWRDSCCSKWLSTIKEPHLYMARFAPKWNVAARRQARVETLVAAHALSLGTTLVTNNEREFRRVAGLRCENWA